MKPQWERVLEAAHAGGAFPSQLRVYREALGQMKLVSEPSAAWTRIDKVLRDDKSIFDQVVMGHVHDLPLARDSDGYIYVSHEHALDIALWRIEALADELRVTKHTVIGLGVLVALAVLGRFLH